MIDQSGAARVLGPHHNRIRRILLDSWDTYAKILEDYPFFADDKTARANVVHAQARGLAYKEFDNVANAVPIPHPPSSFMVVFAGRLFTRFKRLDGALRPDNVSTIQSDDMLRQFPLPGYGPSPSYLIAGYVLNKLETAIESIHITLPLPSYNLWSYEINEEGAVGEVVEVPLIFPLDDMITKTKVQPKPQFQKKKDTNKE